ncbi:MAG: AAA family ATPase [Deltaproteobacteria bacterium]|nr:AAA family ATPase [Deltaproteobacteria bacterium]
MLNSLIIRNFRIFKELKINRVNRVNLFVGKNNSGKSCLLEALQIYASKGNRADLYKIVLSRDENWESLLARKRKDSIRKISALLGYLFNGYVLPDINGKAIEIGPGNSEADLLKIRHRAFHITEDEEGRRIRTPVEQESTEDDFIDIQTALEVTQGEKRLYYIPLEYNRYISSMRRIVEFNNTNFQVAPARQINDSDISALWDNIN